MKNTRQGRTPPYYRGVPAAVWGAALVPWPPCPPSAAALQASRLTGPGEFRAHAPVPPVGLRTWIARVGSSGEPVHVPSVEEITGDPPRTFEEWARAHSQDFANEAMT